MLPETETVTRAEIAEWQVLRAVVAAGKGNDKIKARLVVLSKKLNSNEKER